MAKFDFISGEGFRASLESDYHELLTAMEYKAWKTVHVLSGSIIEAVLVDYLVTIDYKNKSSKDPLEMTLGELIAACKKEGILTQRSADLSSVVKDYRNLIHPGRVVRVREPVDEKGAQVALALVEMIIKDVAQTKEQTYGYTAEQIVSKVEQDSSVLGVIQHVLKEVKEFELERLLLKVLPQTYFAYLIQLESSTYAESETAKATLPTLAVCFRRAFEFAPDEIKRKATKNFVRIIKEEGKTIVLAYEATLFRAADLKYLAAEDAQLVKTHVLTRVNTETNLNATLALLEGIGSYIDEDDAPAFADTIMRVLTRLVTPDIVADFISRVYGEYSRMSSMIARETLRDRISVWHDRFEAQGNTPDADIARNLLDELIIPDDIPF